MRAIATARIDGPEARGTASIVDDGNVIQVVLSDLWVAPGAPDVRLYLGPHDDGRVDDEAIDLGHLPDGRKTLAVAVPAAVDITTIRAVTVFCKVYGVFFGHGTFTDTTGADRS